MKGKAYLSDFFNGSAENINDNKPLLHTWSWFHLHQHSVSKEHEKGHVCHLKNRWYIIQMREKISADIITNDYPEYNQIYFEYNIFKQLENFKIFESSSLKHFLGKPKNQQTCALVLKRWKQKMNYCSAYSVRPQSQNMK